MSTAANAARKQRSLSIGLIVTTIFAALAAIGLLDPLERIGFDLRSQWFSHATPPPSTDVVHIDIDDSALETWKRWPWPRADIAAVLDQLTEADAKVVAFDLLFDDPQQVRYLPDENDSEAVQTIRDDLLLAGALERTAYGILAIACERHEPREDWQQRAIDALQSDVAQSIDSLATAAKLTQAEQAQCQQRLSSLRSAAIRDFLFDTHERLGTLPAIDQSLKQLLPAGQDDALEKMLRREHARVTTVLSVLDAFPRTEDPTRRYDLSVPIGVLSDASSIAGSVSYEADPDGTVRTMPLWNETHGRLVPYYSLTAAAAFLDVPLGAIRIEDDHTVLPDAQMPDGSVQTIRIPMMHHRAGDGYTLFPNYRIEIAWPSNSKTWNTMYDPAGKDPVQHISMGAIIELAETIKATEHNARGAQLAFAALVNDEMLGSLFDASIIDRYNAIAAKLAGDTRDPTERAALLSERDDIYADVIDNCAFVAKDFASLDPADLSEEERQLKQLLDEMHPRLRDFAQAEATSRQLIANRRAELREKVSGKICLVGWTATGSITDKIHTALHPDTPGVVGHGAVINQILTGHYLTRVSVWVDVLVIFLLGAGVTLITSWMPPVRALVVSTVIGTAYVLLNGVALFDYGNTVVAIAGPSVAGMAAWMSVTVYRLVREQRERARITKQFKNYVSKDLVDLLVADPMLIKQGRHELTCMFCDIAGFTQVSEQLGPEEIIELLNRYLRVMTHRIMDGRGTVNKYMGDCIMAFWGAPLDDDTHTLNACRSVMSCFDAMRELEKDPFFQKLPKLTIRFGLATGPMMVGDCGAPPDRSDYTVIGDTVNLASRLESANKQFDTRVLINARTAELLGDTMLVRPIGQLQVVGKADSVGVFELVNTQELATDEQKRLVALTTEMIEAYTASRFDACIGLCEQIDAAFNPTKLTARYRQACEDYLESAPPESFRGELVLSEK